MTLGACVLATDFDSFRAGAADAGTEAGGRADGGPVDAGPIAPICEADASFVADERNCGACGHDCLGGECTDSVCQPFALAGGVTGISNLHADGDTLYVGAVGDRALFHVPKTGGDLVRIAQGSQVYEFAFNAAAIFYTGDANLRRLPRGQSVELALTSSQDAISVAAADDYVYWCDYANGAAGAGALYRRRESDGEVTVLVPNTTNCETLALAGTDVVYGQNGNGGSVGAVWRVPQIGGAPVKLSSNGARRLVVDGGWVYFVTFDSTQVRRVSLDGASETLLGASPAGTIRQGNVAVDDAYVYWTVNQDAASGGGVYRAPKAGGTTAALVSNRKGPFGLVVDDRAIYWSEDGTGKILKVAK